MFRDVLDQTLHVTCLIMWIFAAAILFGAIFDGLGAVDAIKNIFTQVGVSGIGVIALMLASFVGMGMILDDTAMLLVVAPLYIPVVQGLGYSLVWFGVLYVITCQMAYITPPFGYNLFIMRGIAPKDVTLTDIYKSALPFVAVQAIALVILMLFPQISLWLPQMLFGPVIGLGTIG
jgi:TRAP-type mannitol/chloroaromatic compound transport system permease large subunit